MNKVDFRKDVHGHRAGCSLLAAIAKAKPDTSEVLNGKNPAGDARLVADIKATAAASVAKMRKDPTP